MTYASGMEKRTDLPTEQRIARHVFIKAPRSLKYGPVARLIDDLKGAGANPVALQIDSLD
jgi:biopolymer transport protein ExbD